MTRIENGPLLATPGHNGPNRRLVIALITAVIVAIAAIIVAVVQTVKSTPSASPSPSVSASPSTSISASGSPSASPSTSAASSPSPPPFDLGYQPLYPFADLTAAQAWQSSYRSAGTDAWHLDTGQTALNFTQQYLGLAGIDVITSTTTDSSGAHVGVGFRTPNATLSTAAVLHLVRFGPLGDAPWEVVGSDDTTFSLDTPKYAARVSSPITVAGRITGVDESITVGVRSLTATTSLGQTCCTPAGGDNQPWSATVTYRAPASGPLTIVATTGGHLQQIERFAITAAIGASS